MARAIAGIETLIIVIAMIIVSAVAAGVLLHTSQVLQDRALHVGKSSEQRVNTGIDPVRVMALANETTHQVYGFEVLVRLVAGSDPMLMESILMIVTVPEGAFEATWQSSRRSDFAYAELTNPVPLNTSGTSLDVGIDLDHIPDYENDDLTFYYDESGDKYFSLETGFSTATADADGTSWYGATTLVNVTTEPFYDDGQFSQLHGYITFIADLTHPDIATAGDLTTFLSNNGGLDCGASAAFMNCSVQTEVDNPDWWYLKPLYRFGVQHVRSDGDDIFEEDEVFRFRFKLTEPYVVNEEELVSIALIARSGLRREAQFTLPTTMLNKNIIVWP